MSDATRQHIEFVVRQRDKISRSLEGSVAQLCAYLERTPQTPAQAVAWWQWARTQEVPGLTSKIAKALDTSITQLVRWQQYGIPQSRDHGKFPNVEGASNGRPCVYLLVKDARVVYVGSSQSVRDRLRAHWKSDKRSLITDWEVISCATKTEMLQLEADLIFQHQPWLNVALRRSRAYVR